MLGTVSPVKCFKYQPILKRLALYKDVCQVKEAGNICDPFHKVKSKDLPKDTGML